MKKADILSASKKLGIPTSEIMHAIGGELQCELSQENITLKRAREILEISDCASSQREYLASMATAAEVRIIVAKLNAATTLEDLKAVEKECAAAIENELRGLERANEVWEVGSRQWNAIAMKLLEEPGATMESLMNLWGELSFPRYSTKAARNAIESKINELLQIELACPETSLERARGIYDLAFSDFKTKMLAIKVLLRLLPS